MFYTSCAVPFIGCIVSREGHWINLTLLLDPAALSLHSRKSFLCWKCAQNTGVNRLSCANTIARRGLGGDLQVVRVFREHLRINVQCVLALFSEISLAVFAIDVWDIACVRSDENKCVFLCMSVIQMYGNAYRNPASGPLYFRMKPDCSSAVYPSLLANSIVTDYLTENAGLMVYQCPNPGSVSHVNTVFKSFNSIRLTAEHSFLI